jgi:hypothetical protein
MRIAIALALSAGLLVGACGGGQTEATEAEEALTNDLQPAAPSPGTVVPSGGEVGNQTNGSTTAAPGGNTQ